MRCLRARLAEPNQPKAPRVRLNPAARVVDAQPDDPAPTLKSVGVHSAARNPWLLDVMLGQLAPLIWVSDVQSVRHDLHE